MLYFKGMVVLSSLLAALSVLTNVAATIEATRSGKAGARFALDVCVISPTDRSGADTMLAVEDATGRLLVSYRRTGCPPSDFPSGRRLRIFGSVSGGTFPDSLFATAERIVPLGQGTAVTPVAVTPRELQSGAVDNRLVTVRGIVCDAFKDEIDARSHFLVLNCTGESVYATFISERDCSAHCRALLNAEVDLTGVCQDVKNSYRRFQGRVLSVPDLASLHVRRKGDTRFDAPAIDPSVRASPEEICRLGERTCAGRVLATWQGSHILLKTGGGARMGVEMTTPEALPTPGTHVEVVGMPSTDLYQVNLTHAQWRPTADRGIPDDRPTDISAADILQEDAGRARLDPRFKGQCIRLTGTIVALPTFPNDNGILHVDDHGILVPIDISENAAARNTLEVGCRVSVVGICIVDSERWMPFSHFPRTKGFFLVVRTPADITLLARPSIWTPRRFLSVIGVLLLALAGFLVWNRILNRLVRHKSLRLMKEEITHARADIRTDERMRLSAELHDSVSQTLTGLAGQLSAAIRVLDADPSRARPMLLAADRLLKACRTNLRLCLTSLRSAALDEADLETAVRNSLKFMLGDTKLLVRIDVSRNRLPDSTVHALLCILLELVGNACNHGHARTIQILGVRVGERLRLSVADDGQGFDLRNAPGLVQGHFGLDGIRTRAKHFGGTFSIHSTRGKGTCAELVIPLTHTSHA